tara:strand:- start:3750 stop:5069 length:1320 start_codon:yes stop_codon:yes gene_type:complete
VVKISEDWQKCLDVLDHQLPKNEFNTMILPIQCQQFEQTLKLYFPNDYLLNNFSSNYQPILEKAWENDQVKKQFSCQVGSAIKHVKVEDIIEEKSEQFVTNLNPNFTLSNYIKGNSNEVAVAAAHQVSKNPGVSYNPLVIYGGVGLGKTHLMHSIGHEIIRMGDKSVPPKIYYVHSERFVSEMIRALQTADMERFKHRYRSLEVLLIDDIQFFARKERSQEELFHTVNSLLDSGQQIILTSDRYPKELDGIEDRLKSRFAWGLSVCIEPPELETRVAILLAKAQKIGVSLPESVAFFMASEIQSNVRELEGALRRVIASSEFQGEAITIDFTKQTLKDLIVAKMRMITVDSIIGEVAKYFNLKTTDLLSKKRTRHIARARQIAMKIAYESTSNSYPQIADAFGVDHTTVMYACRKVSELLNQDPAIKEDFDTLSRKINQ